MKTSWCRSLSIKQLMNEAPVVLSVLVDRFLCSQLQDEQVNLLNLLCLHFALLLEHLDKIFKHWLPFVDEEHQRYKLSLLLSKL